MGKHNGKIFWFGLLGVVFFITTAILGALQFDNYSHISQFISESYATGTTYGEELRFYGFVPSGVFLSLFSFFLMKSLPRSKTIIFGLLGFTFFYALGTIVVSIFPCDAGCAQDFINPSISQIIHSIMGALTYLIVPFSLILVGIGLAKFKNSYYMTVISLSCGIVSMLFFFILVFNLESDYIGLLQRVIEISILSWVLLTAINFKNTKSPICKNPIH